MPRKRKLWKVTRGWDQGVSVDASSVERPESRVKAYEIYVANNRRARTHDFSQVWVDERNGQGWELYETIRHDQ